MNWAVVVMHRDRNDLVLRPTATRTRDSPQRVKPDVVVRLGGLPASRVLQERFATGACVPLAFDGAGFVSDPDRLVTIRVRGVPDSLREPKADGEYLRLWSEASTHVSEWLAKLDREDDTLHELSVARCVVEASSRRDVSLVIGSSMPVRDVEWWTPARTSPTYSNRGVNGHRRRRVHRAGRGRGSRAIGLVGDITMLHDVSALVDG